MVSALLALTNLLLLNGKMFQDPGKGGIGFRKVERGEGRIGTPRFGPAVGDWTQATPCSFY